MLLSKILKTDYDSLFEDSVVLILLVGPPESAKTMFLTLLMHHLKSSYFADVTNSTKTGMIDYLFANGPRYFWLMKLIAELKLLVPGKPFKVYLVLSLFFQDAIHLLTIGMMVV